MIKSISKHFDNLRAYLESVPLVDCHDHSYLCEPKYTDAINMIVTSYLEQDMVSAVGPTDVLVLKDQSVSVEKRWPILQRAWQRSCHTGYAQVMRRVLKKYYGVEELTLDSIKKVDQNLLDLTDRKVFEGILEDANIVIRIQDLGHIPYVEDVKRVLDGSFELTPRSRLVIPLPRYHNICNYEAVQQNMLPLEKTVTCLDEYLHSCREIFEGYKRFGAVAFKDQSAYKRTLKYENSTRAEAEIIFNKMIADPRKTISYPDELKPLDDYLFNEFIRIARDLDLPVQIHTGHMAGCCDDIRKGNAVLLTNLIDLHRETRFDLLHANWPYSGELLFLAKNYPNVTIDLCWTHIIDPVYCQQFLKQSLSCVPHGKIHGFGSDYCGMVDRAWAHASIARDNIAVALSDMIDMEYIDYDDAKKIGFGWLFENANDYFRLGLEADLK